MSRYFLCSQNKDSINNRFIQLLISDFVAAEFPKTTSPKPARIPPQTPPAGGKSVEAGRIHSPRQIVSPCRVLFNSFNHLDFARNSFELRPIHTARKNNLYFVSDSVAEIKKRLDLVEIIGEHVPLKPAGANMKGLCPFHQERTPSFMVHKDRQTWHCFGCFPAGQKVKTPFGYHDIETVDDSHYVISGKGNIQKVLASHEHQYEGDLINLRLRKLTYPVSLTADHQVFVVRGAPSTRDYKVFARRYKKYLDFFDSDRARYLRKVEKYFPVKKISAGDISKGDLLLYPVNEDIKSLKEIDLEVYLDKRTNLGPVPRRIPLKIPLSEGFLKLCGYYIAEGSNHRAYIRFSLGNHEEKFASDIVDLIKNIFGLTANIYRRKEDSKSGLEITACHSQLAIIFANLMGKGAGQKHIPFVWQYLAYEQQMILVDAIHRGDGTTFFFTKAKHKHKHKSTTTVSLILAEQISDILLRNSLFPTITIQKAKIDKNNVNHRQAYTVSWSEEARSRYKLWYYYEGVKYWILPLLSLKKSAYSGLVYNLTIDTDHTYIASSFMVANCGESGDLFTFIEKMEGIDFVTTLKILAERAGVELERVDPKMRTERQRMLELLTDAAGFYQRYLLTNTNAQTARDYLHQRGISSELAKEWGIGYAPEGWETITEYFKIARYSEAEIIKAGLAIGRDSSTSQRRGCYDRFRARIMFPLKDQRGQVVGFSGRLLKEDPNAGGKYINSPQSELFDKSEFIFALDQAYKAIRTADRVVVVEGQFDAVSSHKVGVKNVVAVSGTALTEKHLAVLARFTRNIAFCFDSDQAGEKAGDRSVLLALAQGFTVYRVDLGLAKDPDDGISRDPAGWQKAVTECQEILTFLFERLGEKNDLTTVTGRRAAAQSFLHVLQAVADPLTRSFWVSRLAGRLGVDERLLREAFSRPVRGPNAARKTTQSAPDRDTLILRQALGFMLRFPQLRPELDPLLAQVFPAGELLACFNLVITGGPALDIKNYISDNDTTIAKLTSELELLIDRDFSDFTLDQQQQEARGILRLLLLRAIQARLQHVHRQLQEAEESAQAERVVELTNEFTTLTTQLYNLRQE